MASILKNGGSIPSALALKSSLSLRPDTSTASTMLTQYQQDLLLQGEQEIDESLADWSETLPLEYAVSTEQKDFPVDALVKRVRNEDIVVPKFQRGFVWSQRESSRFIESLLLGLPVPSVFLAREAETEKLLVIDGQQRLLSLRYFYDELWPSTEKTFALTGVQPRLEKATYSSLAQEDRRRLDDSSIHVIIVKQDEPSDDSSSIYHIFERLNTSGVSLTPHEIRTAIHHGPFAQLLEQLNQIQEWRSIYGPPNKLMRDQELILRFLALFYDEHSYARPMKGFLNSFMGKNKKLLKISSSHMRLSFENSIKTLYAAVGKKAFKPSKAFNAAMFDAVMIGLARRLQTRPLTDLAPLASRYSSLLSDAEFLRRILRATADEESVTGRIRMATEAFADLP